MINRTNFLQDPATVAQMASAIGAIGVIVLTLLQNRGNSKQMKYIREQSQAMQEQATLLKKQYEGRNIDRFYAEDIPSSSIRAKYLKDGTLGYLTVRSDAPGNPVAAWVRDFFPDGKNYFHSSEKGSIEIDKNNRKILVIKSLEKYFEILP